MASELYDTTRTLAVYELLAPYADQFSITGGASIGCTAYYLGLLATTLGRFENSEAHFGDAQAAHERIGAPTWLARTGLEWARMLLTRRQPGDARRARELLGQALATARELGLGGVERQAVAVLQECPDGLSADSTVD